MKSQILKFIFIFATIAIILFGFRNKNPLQPTNYFILMAGSTRELENQVNMFYSRGGYEYVGGVSIYKNDSSTMFAQAMQESE